MTTETLFNENVNPENYDFVDETGDKDYVAQLVGEGKKFRDVNALAKGKMQSDLFVQKLLAEKRDLETRLNSSQSVEDLIKSLKNDQTLSNPGGERRPDEGTGTKPEDIQRIVQETVAAREEEAKKARNLSEVTETLRSTFGNNYVAELEERTKDLGVGKAFLDDLAKTNPKAFLKLVGVEKTKENPSLFTPPNSQINTGAKITTGTGERTYSYYEKIRKSDPALYRSLQTEMFQQAVKLGDNFYR